MKYEFKTTEQMRPYCYIRVRCADGKVRSIAKRAAKLATSGIGNTRFGFITNRCW